MDRALDDGYGHSHVREREPPALIGLTGRARHGKDTTAGFLGERGYVRYGFADALKGLALAVDPYVPSSWMLNGGERFPLNFTRLSRYVELHGWDHAKGNSEVRRLLQSIGTEGVRDHLGDDAWIRALDLRLRLDDPPLAVVSDVRFPNEEEYVHRRGGEVWRIVRLDEHGDPYEGISPGHPSEAYVDELDVDRVLHAASLDELRLLTWAALP